MSAQITIPCDTSNEGSFCNCKLGPPNQNTVDGLRVFVSWVESRPFLYLCRTAHNIVWFHSTPAHELRDLDCQKIGAGETVHAIFQVSRALTLIHCLRRVI
jgi:hypothetical protein